MAQDLKSVNSNSCSPCFCLPLMLLLPHVAALDKDKATLAAAAQGQSFALSQQLKPQLSKTWIAVDLYVLL